MITIMRVVAYMASLLCSSVGLAQPSSVQVEVLSEKVDRFDGSTTYVYPVPGSRRINEPTLRVLLAFDTETRKRTELWVGFISGSEDWRYIDCHHLDWLVDDKRATTGESSHEGSVISHDRVLEYIDTAPTPAQVAKLASGTKVEAKICNTEIVLSDEDMQALRELNQVVATTKK